MYFLFYPEARMRSPLSEVFPCLCAALYLQMNLVIIKLWVIDYKYVCRNLHEMVGVTSMTTFHPMAVLLGTRPPAGVRAWHVFPPPEFNVVHLCFVSICIFIIALISQMMQLLGVGGGVHDFGARRVFFSVSRTLYRPQK